MGLPGVGTDMKRKSVIFHNPYRIEIKEESVPEPASGEVLIETQLSAISAGTELLVYRGLMPAGLAVDTIVSSLAGTFQYPLKYGYTTIGKIAAMGPSLESNLLGRRVFCFHSHESCFLAKPEDLIAVPDDMDSMDAIFLSNMETAVNFLMDGHPLIGERVVVFGQGIVGLLTTALLAGFPLAALVSLDCYPLRRETALALGVHAAFDPQAKDTLARLQDFLTQKENGGPADLVYELSGNPQALNDAIQIAGFYARVVIGSWYGQKRVELELGGQFHRSRIQLISSQVSSLAPEFSGRWTKQRRIDVALDMIKQLKPSQFITHKFSVEQAARAFELLDTHPEEVLQVILTY